MRALAATLLLPMTVLAGCAGISGPPDELVLAYTFKDDHVNTDKDPARLARWIQDATGRPTKIYQVDDQGAAIQALRFGHAHAGFLDGGGAWLGWTLYGLDAIAADQTSDGRTHYVAQGWVRNDSDIQTLEDLAGRDSCHTGWLKSAGMLMPMGYLIGHDIAEVVGDPDDIASLQTTIDAFFGTATVPESGHPYYDYAGAFRCLTEGAGDVAFVKDTSYEDHCEPHPWCLPRDQYRPLEPAFGAVPSHAVMVGPDVDASTRDALREALLDLNGSPGGQDILHEVLETPGMAAVTTQEHLGDYREALRHIPGLDDKYKRDLNLDDA